eukprot:CAMPEP_0176153404 /NCGR_PEP_ID=MMETSP0120_2-20121206/78365_1 /TAXON_ID=160619 /ORGANISM="Kryptoperidinium foliaceum, Strain CCMP 1326" /LENGTH=250 /DNA_ID=CAMNT_0017490463 /DNA_START=1 /DNA_END=754 /DNA_ORIENTATION=-
MSARGGDLIIGAVDGPTTLMIRNLPPRLCSLDLVAELEIYTPRTSFDYVYVPWERTNKNNTGFAFVNFVDTAIAAKVLAEMDGQAWRYSNRRRPAKVVPAHVQGLDENLRRFAEQEALDAGHVPLLLSGGCPISLQVALSRAAPTSCRSPASTPSSVLGELGVWASESSAAGEKSEITPPPPPAGRAAVAGRAELAPFPPPGLPSAICSSAPRSAEYIACRKELDSLLQALSRFAWADRRCRGADIGAAA